MDKIVEIFYRIIKNYPFSNGNKRTAIFSIIINITINILNFYKNKIKEQSEIYLKKTFTNFFENISINEIKKKNANHINAHPKEIISLRKF